MWVTLGSGILSYMSAQAGANQVIALEASSMAEKIEIVRIVFFSKKSKKKKHTQPNHTNHGRVFHRWSKLPTAVG